MEQEQFKCTGDCLNCRKTPNDRREQWQYCASQFTYNTMRMIQDMQGTIEEMKAKISAIQDNEALVFNPSDTTQSGDGAESRSPETI